MTYSIPQPIGRTALAVEVTDRLRQMILEGQLEQGDKIQERQLTEQFGVSRTPLREALKVLAAEGLLELIPNRGTVISRQTTAELREIFPVLASLEGLAGELAALNATSEELRTINALTATLRQSHEAADRPQYFETNLKIHEQIIAAARNLTLTRSHALLAFRAQRARYQANLTAERWKQAIEEHEAIADALTARDSERAAYLMKAHMMHKLDVVIAGALQREREAQA